MQLNQPRYIIVALFISPWLGLSFILMSLLPLLNPLPQPQLSQA